MVSSGDKTPYYRAGKGRRVLAALIEQVVLDHMNEKVDSHESIDRFVSEVRGTAAKMSSAPVVEAKAVQKRLDTKIANLLRVAENGPDSPGLVTQVQRMINA